MDNETNLTLFNQAYATSHQILNPADQMALNNKILAAYTQQYIEFFQYAAYIIFAYVIYNNFFKKPTIFNLKIPRIEKSLEIDIDELAIIPAVVLLMIALEF